MMIYANRAQAKLHSIHNGPQRYLVLRQVPLGTRGKRIPSRRGRQRRRRPDQRPRGRPQGPSGGSTPRERRSKNMALVL